MWFRTLTLRPFCHRQTVIQLSNALKTRGAAGGGGSTPAAAIAAGQAPAANPNPLSSTLRTKMVRLTNATQEFVMLLHVSSFSPAPTPGMRSYSPMVGLAAQPSPLPVPSPGPTTAGLEDGRLASNLSRNRSANPSWGSKLL